MPTSPRHGLQKWSAGFTQSDVILNADIDILDVRLSLSVRSATETAPLGGDAAGDCYIIPASPTGAFSAFTQNNVAWYDGTTWYEFTPVKGQTAYINDNTTWVGWDGSTWGGITTTNALAVTQPVRNATGGTLTKGTPVYISGYNVGQDLIEVSAADSDSASTMPCIGLIAEDVSNNANGTIVVDGDLNGIDTSSFSVGDQLYVSGTAGNLTATRPTGTALVQEVAIVVRAHASLGVLQVVPGSEYEGLPNLPENNVWLGDASGVPQETTMAQLRAAMGTTPIHTLHVETVANQDYVLTFDAPYPGTITTLRTKTESGTCTVTGYINGVALGGTANSASSTAQEQAHASANAYSKGDEIKITVTSNSSAVDLEVTFYGTRTDL